MHWYFCNDAKRERAGVPLGGSILRRGRFFLRFKKWQNAVRVEWSFWNNIDWLEMGLRFGGEDRQVSLTLVLPWLAFLTFAVGVPPRWLSWWMIEDRMFSLRVGYGGSVLSGQIAHAEWAEDCGMTSYYRAKVPREYSGLKLWPGWEWTLTPRPLDWTLGRIQHGEELLRTSPISFWMDGREHKGAWTLKKFWRERPRWPWPYRVSVSSYVEIEHPPQFAGKGENSWDCNDDAIYGMGTNATNPKDAIGEYIHRVYQNRARYGEASS